MLQKRNDYEVIELLLKDSMHLRQLALELKIIPSTMMRILKKLVAENIIDFKVEGKNNTYFIKDTLEAKRYILITEQYKFIKIITNNTIRRISTELIAQTKGELIILFGSYAKNNSKQDSDIDIYIETKDNILKEKLKQISSKLSIKIGAFNKEGLLEKEIIKNHILIQNSERFYELIK